MKNKIAVINLINTERTLLAKALSCASGYQFIQNRNIYEWQKLFQIDENQIYCFNNQFLLLSSSFIKRTKSEFKYPAFVSNGAVFSEVLFLKSNINEKFSELYKPEEIEMIEILLDLTGRYAARHYDMVIHVRNADSGNFDELSIGFYEKHRIAYRLYDNGDIKDIIENIISEVEIPKALPVDSAIYDATLLVTFKN